MSLLPPLLFSAYPALALLAHNIEEVSPDAGLRPLIASLALGGMLLLAGRLVLGDWAKASLASTIALLLILGYGHLYGFLKDELGLPPSIVRHRYLAPMLAVALAGLILGIRRLRSDLFQVHAALTVTGVVLLLVPVYTIVQYGWLEARRPPDTPALVEAGSALRPPDGREPPDIYYIILDTYTRGDTLAAEYGFDNSSFLETLEGLGFYVAECSRSNYANTFDSLLSSLNLNYIDELPTDAGAQEGAPGRATLLRHSAVRGLLEGLGYRTVAFNTGYRWTRLDDAAIYLTPGDQVSAFRVLEPFEGLFLRTTAALVILDSWRQTALTAELEGVAAEIAFPHSSFVRRQLYILETLPTLPRLPGPKFVFAHILIPHVPRVFEADGSLVDDPRYYSGEGEGAANSEFDIRGYLNEIQFVNSRILDIVRTILAESSRPPIVILQGDTGRGGQDAFEILNVYYVMGEANPDFYSSISPVNSFRLLFDSYFGGTFGLLADESYDRGVKIDERWAHCLP